LRGLLRVTLLVCPLTAAAVASAAAQVTAESNPSASDPALARHGRLVIVGGGLSRSTESVYRAVLDGRRLDGSVCIIPTAGGDNPDRSIASAVAAFDQWGGPGTATGIPLSTANPEVADDAAVADQIGDCSAFYFTGGVQSRIVNVFRPEGRNTPAFDVLLDRFRQGAVVAGSSAGAAVMSDPMIAGGSTTASLEHGIRRSAADADDEDDSTDAPGLLIERGMGFFPPAVVDQHFLARGRIGRLITAVLDLEEFDLGFGIDENTALVVDGDAAHPAGESGIIIVDTRGAQRDGRTATNVRLHLMGVGDRFAIDARRLVVAETKAALMMTADSVVAPEDIFARWAFLHVLHQFARSPQTEIALPVPGGELTLRKGPDFAARSNPEAGVQDTPAGLTITGLLVDVRRQN
jgi:cyanophycinase